MDCKDVIVCLASSDVVGIDVAIEDGVDGEPGYGLYPQLLSDVLAVRDDGGEAYVQAVGNLLVHQSAGNECQHLDLACREFVLRALTVRYLGDCLKAISVTLQCHQASRQSLLALHGVERGNTLQGGIGVVAHQHDSTEMMVAEVVDARQVYAGRDEAVGIGVGSVVDELFQRTETAHHDRGHHLLDDALQADARQRVGIDDGYFYRALARYWCRI